MRYSPLVGIYILPLLHKNILPSTYLNLQWSQGNISSKFDHFLNDILIILSELYEEFIKLAMEITNDKPLLQYNDLL